MPHQELVEQATASVLEENKRQAAGEWRLDYHITAPAFWINDPNGFCYYNGEYHLFYQHHPYSVKWDNMHWGHIKSRDLTHWEDLPVALAPSEPYDKDGCFSGSAIEKDGRLYLFYTGNIWTGPDPDTDLKQSQCLAISDDGITFTKYEHNPVISEAPEGNIDPAHFRDPKVWEEDGMYYCILGSKSRENTGQALLYKSSDLLNWEYISIVAKGTGNMGYMWECPDLITVNGQDMIVMSPQGVRPEGDLYHNLHQAVYLPGKLEADKENFQFEQFKLLDYGFDYYAPQTTLDAEGRRLMVGWMAMWESPMPEEKEQWTGAMTLPRELWMEKGRLYSFPVQELEALRQKQVSYNNVHIHNALQLDGINGKTLELRLTIDAKRAGHFGLSFRGDDDGTEKTTWSYDVGQQKAVLDRSSAGEGPGGVRKAEVPLQDGLMDICLYIDNSSVEIFMQHGAASMTARIYPKFTSTAIMFFSDEPAELVKVEKWELKPSITTRL
ncbi:glycoside hydrolase family 32 protein [Sinobaca sp. H24]|uniref:glycoside hydrolase family 32 protein n=1 Tax=Sinobaca sp. H24 TaxID=2923376 RepID=UPI00207AF7F0|nr:glycoside hydrolase family 32 protein [Sinobaca sp. H24]